MINWKAIKTAADPIWKPAPNVPPLMNKWAARPVNGIHTFAKGDTLQGIADRYGVSHRRLAQANPAANPTALRVGAPINIPINERDYFIKEKGFDPEPPATVPEAMAWSIEGNESQHGKYMRPIGASSTALGWFHMLKPKFLDVQKAHPEEMKGWRHEDLLDQKKARFAFELGMRDNMRRYQYLNGKPMSTQLWARSWYKPNDLYSQDSINYGNKIFKLMDDYVAQKQQMMKQAPISSK